MNHTSVNHLLWNLLKLHHQSIILLFNFSESNTLDNLAVVLGRPISMTCGESANDSRVQWKVQLFGEFVELFIFNGYTIFQEFPEFHAVSDGIFRLFTSEAQVKHAGTYFCIRINEHRTKKYGMMLTVLGEKLIVSLINVIIT